MLNEISLISGLLAAAVASGLVGLVSRDLERRSKRKLREHNRGLNWHRSAELARNLLVLETIADAKESASFDIAVRARLTPAEQQEAEQDLLEAGLIDQATPHLVRLTASGKHVLEEHDLERAGTTVRQRSVSGAKPSSELHELDEAIDRAVAALQAQHAH